MQTLQHMVERLKMAAREPKGFSDVLCGFFGEDVDVVHVPPMPTDGRKKGRELAVLHHSETEIWMARIPDYHHEDVKVWSENDDLHVAMTLAGTIRGKTFKVPTHFRMKVKSGVIQFAELAADVEASKPMMEFIMEADMPVEAMWDPFEKKNSA